MNKKTTENNEIDNKIVRKKKSYNTLYWLLFLAILAAVGYFGWKNYDFIKEKLQAYYQTDTQSKDALVPAPEWFTLIEEKADKATVYGLQEKIINLQTIVSELTLRQSDAKNLSALNERIDNMQDLLIASVNGKADAQAVLGLIVRLDKLENELNRLSHLNNEGAIMLAVTMLIKENATEGKNFAFEATMLSELAENNHKIAEPLKIINDAAQTGVATNTELAREFDEIYDNLEAKEENVNEQSWKDRLLAKLSELVTIKKSDEKGVNEKHKSLMDTISDLSDNQQFTQIVMLLENSKFATNPALQGWIEKVKNKRDFDAAISKISSYCLALMKINNLTAKE